MTHPAVLPSETTEAAVQPPPTIVAGIAYSTQMEIEWLEGLAKGGRYELLRNLRKPYSERSWGGAGMAVDGDAVQLRLYQLLRMGGRNGK